MSRWGQTRRGAGPRSRRLPLLVLSVLIGALGLLVTAGIAGAASSPGFRPDPGLSKATPKVKPLPLITIGTGKNPDVLVDAAGTAHIVYTQDGGATSPDTLAVCNLLRGRTSCATQTTAVPQAPPSSDGGVYSGNFPAGNHDTDGPAPLAINNQLYVLERRFPDTFDSPMGPFDSNVFEWSSNDGGATLTGPANIGDNQMAGGAILYGDPGAPSIGTISRTQTEGTFFQGTDPGGYSGDAKAQLGDGNQAFEGSVAPDMSGPVIRPIAAFADQNGNVLLREWSGQGNINDVSMWSAATIVSGFTPRIIGGPAGTFLMTSTSRIGGGVESLRKIVNGAVAGAATTLGHSLSQPAISEDASGAIAYAFTDASGVEVRTSLNGTSFAPAQLAAAIPDSTGIAHLVAAATSDGGGFVSFVESPQGAENVGKVVAGAFGSQLDTSKLGLGSEVGGGIGSAGGDPLASSTCEAQKFGSVDAQIYQGGACFVPDPVDRNMSVSFGTVDLNGLLIIPDKGVRIGIDAKLHKIQTSGPVRVVLRASGIPDITLYHGPLNFDVPQDGAGDDLFSPYLDGLSASKVAGFPIDGSIDVKLAKGGVDIPISLKLPKYLGGISGSAVLHASTGHGLSLSSLNFSVPDLNLGALEIKDLAVQYQHDGDVWEGRGELLVPAGGSALDLKLDVQFTGGEWTRGSVDFTLPYPGFPLNGTPPELYFTHGGLDLDFRGGVTLTGLAGFAAQPLSVPGTGGLRDYLVSLDASLKAAFKSPVTLTLSGTTYLTSLQIGQETLTWTLPDSVYFTGNAGITLGPIEVGGTITAQIDPHHHLFGASIDAFGKAFGYKLEDISVAVNQKGFGAEFDGVGFVDYWGEAPRLVVIGDCTTRFKNVPTPPTQARRARAQAADAGAFTVPGSATSADLSVQGAGAAPNVVLIAPGGKQVIPAAVPEGAPIPTSAAAVAVSDPSTATTAVGIRHPAAGTWHVLAAPGSPAIVSVQYATGEKAPSARARITGNGHQRVLRYRASVPADTAITFVEKTGRLIHVIGTAKGRSGSIPFAPAVGPAGRRQIVAEITDNDLPFARPTLTSYVAPPPLRAGRARRLRVHAGRRAFTFRYVPPAHANRVLVTLVTTDGRHLQRTVSARSHGGSLPARGLSDGITVTVTGLGVTGSHGPAASAHARRTVAFPGARRPPRRHKRKR